MEAPAQINPRKLADYLEVMSKAVFQSGMSWNVVNRKWPELRVAMREFDPMALASLSGRDMAKLVEDPRVIRNRRKLDAIVENARTMLELDEKHRGFRRYLRSHGNFEATVADLRKQFRFLGEFGAFHFLYVVREPVPSYEEWCASRGVTPATVTG